MRTTTQTFFLPLDPLFHQRLEGTRYRNCEIIKLADRLKAVIGSETEVRKRRDANEAIYVKEIQ